MPAAHDETATGRLAHLGGSPNDSTAISTVPAHECAPRGSRTMDSPSRTDEMLIKLIEAVVRTSNILGLDLPACPPNAKVQLRRLQ